MPSVLSRSFSAHAFGIGATFYWRDARGEVDDGVDARKYPSDRGWIEEIELIPPGGREVVTRRTGAGQKVAAQDAAPARHQHPQRAPRSSDEQRGYRLVARPTISASGIT